MKDDFCKNIIAIDLDKFMLNSGIEKLSKTLDIKKRRNIKKEMDKHRRNLKINKRTMLKLEIKQHIKNIKISIRTKVTNFLYDNKLLGINKKCWAALVMYQLGYYEWEDVYEADHCGYCGACMDK